MQHNIDFRGTSDTGEPESAAIVPVTDGEPAHQTTFRRPPENLRARTEVVRTQLLRHVMLADFGEHPILQSSGLVTFNGTAVSGSDGKFSLAQPLHVIPWGSPGDNGVAPYVASTKADLSIVDGVGELTFTSVQKAFQGSGLVPGDVNQISVEIVHTGVLSVTVEGAVGEANNIKITVDQGVTTCDAVIAAMAPAAALVVASTITPGAFAAPLWGPSQWGTPIDYTARFLKGGAPGMLHTIPIASLSGFFTASPINCLKKGDVLAIWYDSILTAGATGGRLQSTPENSNTNLGAGQLFNTRAEPAKIPNCIPICRCLDDNNLLFIDGSLVTKGTPAMLGVRAQAIYGDITAAQDAVWNYIGEGGVSTILKTFDNIDEQFKENDTYVTVSNNPGEADYDTLQAAVIDLNTGVGGTIRVLHGSGAFTDQPTTAITFTRKIHVIGPIELTDNLTAGQILLTFAAGSEGSTLRDITTIEGGAPSGISVSIQTARIHLDRCTFNGQVKITGVNAIATLVRDCTLVGATIVGTPTVHVDATSGTQHCLERCHIQSIGQIYEVLYDGVGTAAVGLTIKDCTIVVADKQQAIETASNARGLHIDGLSVSCGPSSDDAGGGLPVVRVRGWDHNIQNLKITANVSADGIRNSLLEILASDSTVAHIHIDCAAQYLRYSHAAGQNPVRLYGNMSVDDLHLFNFKIPNVNVGEGNFLLSIDEPIIFLRGGAVGKPLTVTRLKVSDVGFGALNNAHTFTLIGGTSLAGTDNGVAAEVEPWVLERADIQMLDFIPSLPASNFLVTNIPSGCEIKVCRFAAGNIASSVLLVNSNDTHVLGCYFDNTNTAVNAETGAVLVVLTTSTMSVHGVKVNDNTFVCYKQRDTISHMISFKADPLKAIYHCQFNNNLLDMLAAPASDHTLILFDYTTSMTVIGNTVRPSRATDTPIAYTNSIVAANMVPISANIGTLNVITYQAAI